MENKALAMAYVPWQRFTKVMNGSEGLCRGTIFKELDLPFYGVSAACNMPYREGRGCKCR
ncbi:MAG: spore coat associated protein CotJA [Lachnospiraceae bacterium]|nr:spore coat associated protein CotJA [Lachnospiraceae bacterium]